MSTLYSLYPSLIHLKHFLFLLTFLQIHHLFLICWLQHFLNRAGMLHPENLNNTVDKTTIQNKHTSWHSSSCSMQPRPTCLWTTPLLFLNPPTAVSFKKCYTLYPWANLIEEIVRSKFLLLTCVKLANKTRHHNIHSNTGLFVVIHKKSLALLPQLQSLA